MTTATATKTPHAVQFWKHSCSFPFKYVSKVKNPSLLWVDKRRSIFAPDGHEGVETN